MLPTLAVPSIGKNPDVLGKKEDTALGAIKE